MLALGLGGFVPASSAAVDVSPGLFQKVSSGVALIKTFGCGGKPLGQGTGFLVGESVVMTARHVLHGSCRVRVTVGGRRFTGQRWSYWASGGSTGRGEDLATLKLDRPASGFVFRVRPSSPPAGTNLGFVGDPLGNRLSLNQGKIIWRGKRAGIPLLAVKMLGAEGASGAPFIDDAGRVVGILQVGLGSEDVLGQRTSGVLVGLDLVRWWGPRARLDLCRAYPNGGIAGCPSAAPSGQAGLTLTQAREVARSGVLVREDLTAGWRLESTSTPSTSAACEEYFRREGLLSSKLNSFTNDDAELLSGSVMVYRTAAAARAAYQLTASDPNLECFSASVEADVRDSLEAEFTLDSFSAHRTTTPAQFSNRGAGFGIAASSGYLEWQLTKANTADVYVGRLYWSDVLAGNGLLGFQYLTFGEASIFSFSSAILSSIARVSGYRP